VAKPVGDRKPKGIFVGRVYTGVGRGKKYPYRSIKRGGLAQTPVGLIARAVKAVKSVIVKDDPPAKMSKAQENAILRQIMS
jgi:hypothetical protein